MMNRLIIMLFMLLFSLPSWSAEDPVILVSHTTNEITSALRKEQYVIKQNPRRLYEIVDEVVLPHFDFDRMSSWVLGRYWKTASPQEQAAFTTQFKNLLVRTYANALNDNYDQQIDMLPPEIKPGGDKVVVHTEVQQDSGFPIPIDYKMYLKGDNWKVYDVSVDGISLVANYRTSFAQEIRKGGLSNLIEQLAARNEQFQ